MEFKIFISNSFDICTIYLQLYFIMTRTGIEMNFIVMNEGHLRLKGQGLMTTLTIDLAGYKKINILHTQRSEVIVLVTLKESENNTPQETSLRDGEFIDESSFQYQKVTVVTSCW